MKFWFIMDGKTMLSTVTSLTAALEELHKYPECHAIKCETDATPEEIKKDSFHECGNYHMLKVLRRN